MLKYLPYKIPPRKNAAGINDFFSFLLWIPNPAIIHHREPSQTSFAWAHFFAEPEQKASLLFSISILGWPGPAIQYSLTTHAYRGNKPDKP